MSAMKTIYEIVQELENIYIPQVARKFYDAIIKGYYDERNMKYVIEASKDNLNIEKKIDLRCDMDLDKELIEVENFLKFNLYTEEFDKYMNPPVEEDVVNHPSHYTSGAHECIDVMEAMFGTYAVMNFCKCNIFKYRFRADKKNGEEDIKKAEWYESKLIELQNKPSEELIFS